MFRCREKDLGIRHGRTPYFCICNSVLSCAILDVDVCMNFCRLQSSLCQCSLCVLAPSKHVSLCLPSHITSCRHYTSRSRSKGARQSMSRRGAEAHNTHYHVLQKRSGPKTHYVLQVTLGLSDMLLAEGSLADGLSCKTHFILYSGL